MKNPEIDNNYLYNMICDLSGNKHDRDSLINSISLLNKLQLDSEDFNKFMKLSSHMHFSTLFLMFLSDAETPKEINFINVLLEYFLFSKDIGLKIHLFNGSRTENFSSILSFLGNLPDKFLFHDFKEGPKSNEELLASSGLVKFKSEEFNLKFGKIFASQGKFLVLHNLPYNISGSLFNFLYYNNCLESFKVTSFQDLNSAESKFEGLSSILTTTEVSDFSKLKMSDILASNLSQLVTTYDIISFYSDKTNSDKDRKKSNRIIENQFNNRKRKFPYGYTQDVSQNREKISGVGVGGNNLNFNFSSNVFNEDELYGLDSVTFSEFYNSKFKNDFHQIKNDNFLNLILNDKNILVKYLTFANEFIPKISIDVGEKIKFLSNHLIKSFPDLQQFELKDYDEKGENIEKTLKK